VPDAGAGAEQTRCTLSDDLVDVDRLSDWIGDRLEGAGQPTTVERMGQDQGIANALFFLRRAQHTWVLRRPPAVKNHPSASNTEREWRILRALDGTDVPHPRALLFCDDPAVIGAPFLVMERIDGFTPGHELPPPFAAGGPILYDLAMAYVDGLIALASVDWLARGLEGLGKPEGFLERQVARWVGQLDGYRTRDLPEEQFICDWLERNRPEATPAAILHGDYSPFNVMVSPDPPARLAAIVDWDTGTIGDPLLDIGHLLARWVEPGEEGPLGPQAGDLASYPTRAEMASRYAERSGRELSALAYYECLALFKLGVILEGTYARERRAGVPHDESRMAELVPRLFRSAAAFARGEVV
jgi:aminoglycoside phosphotransferase (APT) family kinase protein